MEITNRQRLALEMLLRGPGDTTLTQIASRLCVSSRTIHRELSRIAPLLKERFHLVLSSRSGLGLQVIGEEQSIKSCLEALEVSNKDELAPEERRRMVAAMLLGSHDVMKLFSLTSELGCPTPLVRADLEVLRPWFSCFGLNLILRRGLGIALEGTEASRRQAMAALFIDQFGEAGILSLIRGESPLKGPHGLASKSISQLATPSFFVLAGNILAALPQGRLPVMAPQDYLGLVTHLALSAARCAQECFLAPDADGASTILASSVAVQIVTSLDLPGSPNHKEAEIQALERYLRGAKPGHSDATVMELQGIDVLAEVQELILACSRFGSQDFSKDRILRDGLATHWGPARYRVVNHLPIRNPLLDQIKSGYPELFALVAKAVAWVLPNMAVPNDEIGYLVMHFGSSLERRGKARLRFRALVVCSAGIGSANMLASRIRTELPEIDIVANLSWFDIKDISRDSWDILVSTIPLPLNASEYIMVNPLLDADGVEAIRACLDQRRGQIQEEQSVAHEIREDSTLLGLRQIGRHLTAVIEILEHFQVFTDCDSGQSAGGWHGVVAATVNRLADGGLLKDREQALQDLAERSADGGIVLPGSHILFLHARTAAVSKASLSIHVLNDQLPDLTGAWKTSLNRLVVMLAPRRISPETQDILNEISVSFLDARTVDVLREADAQTIRAHYTRYLDRYFRSFPGQGV